MSNLSGIHIRLQATYVRLIYSASAANDPAARSCMRPVNGTATYEVTGWFYEPKTAAFLIPTTVVNLASLILFLVAMFLGDRVLYQTDPTDPESLLGATKGIDEDGSKMVVELEHGGKYSFWGVSWMPFSYMPTIYHCIQGFWQAVTGDAPSGSSAYEQMPDVEEGVGKKRSL
jgi:hypothetical protein